MKKSRFQKISLFLASVCLLSLCGCGGQSESTLQNGIQITDETPYSLETEEFAEGVIYEILEHYAQKKTIGSLPNATVNKLKTYATQIKNEWNKNPVEERIYITLLQELQENGEGVIDELHAYKKDGVKDLTKTKGLYTALTAILSADYVCEQVYHFCVYSYDVKYQDFMAKYEEYKYPFYLEDAQKALDDRAVLVEKIGQENFVCVMKNGIVLADLFSGNDLQSEQFNSFTDLEVLTFIKALDFSTLSIQEEGWEWMLNECIPDEIGENASYFMRLAQKMKTNGDVQQVKTIMNEFVRLLTFCIESLQESDVALLKGKEYTKILQATFSRFRQEEWTSFEKIATCDIQKADYDAIAIEKFGQAYIDYKNNVQTYTLAQLKESTEKDEFFNVLKGYIAGIYPAFAYGIEL